MNNCKYVRLCVNDIVHLSKINASLFICVVFNVFVFIGTAVNSCIKNCMNLKRVNCQTI